MNVTIYHNPRCSKSRQTLQLIEDKGIKPKIIEYLDNPPNAEELADILNKLGKTASQILRTKEATEEGVSRDVDNDVLIKEITLHPRTMERPIVVCGDKAAIGRPPEAVLDIL